MSRATGLDTTNTYRFKITEEGIYPRDGWGHKAGDEFKNVTFYGPYQKKVPASFWTNPNAKVTIERQQLGVVAGELAWLTYEVKVIESEV